MAKKYAGRRTRRAPSRRVPPLFWAIIGVAVVVLIVLIALAARSPGGANREGIAATNPKSLGPADAPVVVTEYSSFG